VIKARKSVGKPLHLRNFNLAANLSVKSNANFILLWTFWFINTFYIAYWGNIKTLLSIFDVDLHDKLIIGCQYLINTSLVINKCCPGLLLITRWLVYHHDKEVVTDCILLVDSLKRLAVVTDCILLVDNLKRLEVVTDCILLVESL